MPPRTSGVAPAPGPGRLSERRWHIPEATRQNWQKNLTHTSPSRNGPHRHTPALFLSRSLCAQPPTRGRDTPPRPAVDPHVPLLTISSARTSTEAAFAAYMSSALIASVSLLILRWTAAHATRFVIPTP